MGISGYLTDSRPERKGTLITVSRDICDTSYLPEVVVKVDWARDDLNYSGSFVWQPHNV